MKKIRRKSSRGTGAGLRNGQMVRRFAALLAIVAITVLCVVAAPWSTIGSYAYDNTMETESFNVSIAVSEDNSYDITENIRMNYIEPHHGIYRYIPTEGYTVKNIDVPGYDYDTYRENGNIVIQIGSGSYTLTGTNDYTIKYKISMYDDENTDMDMLLINVIPTGWQTDITEASGTITLPKAADLDKLEVYSGSYGTEGNEDNVTVETGTDGTTIRFSASNLPANHGITLSLQLPEGYWEGAPEYGSMSILTWILIFLGPIAAFVIWFLYGRDDHIVKTLEFYPPDGLTPGEIGYLVDKKVDERDVVSTIVYLADKGYIEIEEDENNNFWFIKKEEPENEPKYVKTLFSGIFSGRDRVNSRKMGVKFGRKYQSAMNQLTAMYSENKTFSKPESIGGRFLCGIATLLPMTAYLAWSQKSTGETDLIALLWFVPHMILSMTLACSAFDKVHGASKVKTVLKSIGAVWFFFAGTFLTIFMPNMMNYLSVRRTLIIMGALILATLVSEFFTIVAVSRKKSYTKTLGKILGFKDFIRTAELDKLKALVEDDPEYFYHITPYAYVLGLSDKWISNFEGLEVISPTWYRGYNDSYGRSRYFDTYMMGRMMSDCSQSVSRNIVTPAPPKSSGGHGGSGGGSSWSGGGGFSGGGFSGGGAGGGGGGGW